MEVFQKKIEYQACHFDIRWFVHTPWITGYKRRI